MQLRAHSAKRRSSSRSPTKSRVSLVSEMHSTSTTMKPKAKVRRVDRSRIPSSASDHHNQPAPEMLHIRPTLGKRAKRPSSSSTRHSPEASTSASESNLRRAESDRPLFRSEAVRMAKWHMTPREYKDAKHRRIYGHPDDVKTAMCEYRIKLVEHLGIRPGDKVLEIGCGHGYTTLALAEAVENEGYVMAIDTADENYGSPLTVEQNQTFIISRAPQQLLDRLQFKMQTTVQELFRDYPEYVGYFNKVVFAHSLFYFESTKEIRETLRLLWDKVTPDAELCIAEWGMVESRKAAAAHRAAVNTQATLEAYRKVLEEPYINNVRTAATPNVLKELAQMEGWSNPDPKGKAADGRVTEGFFAPRPEVPEGKWEIGVVLSQKFDQDVRRVCMALPKPWDPAEAFYQISTQWEQMELAIQDHGSDDLEGALCMDVWYARLPRHATRLKPSPNDFMRSLAIRSQK